MHKLVSILILASLALAASSAFAHGDEDHSQDNKKSAVPNATIAGQAGGGELAAAAPQRLADGSLFVPKPVQRQLGIRTSLVRHGELSATVELNGKVIPSPDAGGRVQATQSGQRPAGPQGYAGAGPQGGQGRSAGLSAAHRERHRARQPVGATGRTGSPARHCRQSRRTFEQLEGAVPQKEIEAATDRT